jgi:hypothetical protein
MSTSTSAAITSSMAIAGANIELYLFPSQDSAKAREKASRKEAGKE